MVNSNKAIDSLTLVNKLLIFVKHLIEGVPGEDEAKNDPYEFEENQTYIAKLVHLVNCRDPLAQFQALATLKENFDKGGIQRMKYTIPSIVNSIYKLVQSCSMRKVSSVSSNEDNKEGSEASTPTAADPVPKLPLLKVFQFVYQAIDSIGTAYPETALRLFLQGVLAMNGAVVPGSEVEELGYQFASQALVLYQDQLTDAESKFRAITVIIGTLQRAIFFSPDNFETLITNTVQYCAKLLRKQDQCRALLMCTHLCASEILV